ncbi:hypothetical protein ACFL20_13785 [Spirochaetota bacterium]
MKKLAFLAIFSILFISVGAFAGLKQKNNQSAEYVKTMSRNASTDIDCVYFNPAAAAQMTAGLHLYLGYQFIYQPWSLEAKEFGTVPVDASGVNGDYELIAMVPFWPDLYVNYVMDKMGPGDLAVWLAVSPLGGGAFTGDESVPLIEAFLVPTGSVSIDAESSMVYYNFQLGTSYALMDKMVSLSVGYRLVYGTGMAKFDFDYGLTEKIDAEMSGICHGVIVGISAKPLKTMGINDLTVAVKFEWYSKLTLDVEADNEVITDALGYNLANMNGLVDGAEKDDTIPMNIGIGLAYKIMGINLSWSFNYFLEKETDWGDDADFDNSWETGVGVDFTLPMIPLNIGVGYLYQTFGTPDAEMIDIDFNPVTHQVGVGLTYEILKSMGLKVTLAYSFAYGVPKDIAAGSTVYGMIAGMGVPVGKVNASKMTHVVALGVTAKVL